MSAFSEILSGLKTALELEVRDLDRRLVRVETMIEITKLDGGVLRISRDPDRV